MWTCNRNLTFFWDNAYYSSVLIKTLSSILIAFLITRLRSHYNYKNVIFTFVLSFMDINESHEYASKHFPVGSHFSFLYIGYCNCFILRWKTRKNNKRLLFCISEVCFYNWIYPSVYLEHNALISKCFSVKYVIKLLIIKYFHFIDNCTVLFY